MLAAVGLLFAWMFNLIYAKIFREIKPGLPVEINYDVDQPSSPTRSYCDSIAKYETWNCITIFELIS